MKKFGNVLWGIVLIGIGLILATNALGITDINIFFTGWWTMLIIIPSFIGIFRDNEKKGNVIGLIIGIALFLCCQDILDFEMIWKLAFPTILLVIGISFIFKDTFNKKVTEEIKKLNENTADANEYCSTFSGQEINFDGEEFKGANVSAVFGGVKMDLRKAILNDNQIINCTAIFGGIDIQVPEDVKVKIKSSSMFGGVSDRKKRSDVESTKVLFIDAKCMFGGVEIK